MSTSELHKGQPILAFLAPSRANAAAFAQPSQRSFHHPPSRRVFPGFRNRLGQGFAASSSMSNVLVIVGFRDQAMNILKIIPPVQAQMLFACGSPHHHGEDEVINRPFVVLVSAADVYGQWCPLFVNQDMNLRPVLATVCWIAASRCTSQRSRNRFAVHGLPLPTHMLLSSVETDASLQDSGPYALLLPGLEPFVQDAAGDAKPVAMNCFPLATGPQHVPDAIDDRAVVGTGASWAALLRRLGKMLLKATPQGARNVKVIDILGLCVTFVFANGTPRWTSVSGKNNCPRGVSFSH
jgi:hypothetical protein